jgi:hypothetical protein
VATGAAGVAGAAQAEITGESRKRLTISQLSVFGFILAPPLSYYELLMKLYIGSDCLSILRKHARHLNHPSPPFVVDLLGQWP